MPIRWIINPVIETQVDGILYRESKVNTLLDPGRPGKTYKHSTVMPPVGGNWCLSFVRGASMSGLDADPQCIDLLETDYEDQGNHLVSTIRDLGWTAAKRTRVLQRLIDKGIDTTGLTLDTPLWHIVIKVGQWISPSFTKTHLDNIWVK